MVLRRVHECELLQDNLAMELFKESLLTMIQIVCNLS